MQTVSPLKSCTVHGIRLDVEERFELSGPNDGPYYEVTVTNLGTKRFPEKFKKRFLVINSKLFSQLDRKVGNEAAIYAGYEKVGWIEVGVQDWQLTNSGEKKKWLTLNAGFEPVVSRKGTASRTHPFLIEEAKF